MKRLIIEICIIIAAVAVIVSYQKQVNNLKTSLDYAENNVKAYASLNDSLVQNNRVFQINIADLNRLNDSIFTEMKNVSNRLKIRENQIKQMQYLMDSYNRVDTVFVKGDTIFKEPEFKLDTTFGDQWGKTRLQLEYPNIITVGHSYTNKKHIIFVSYKEPVKERKWFLPRWFTRKRTYVEATVVDENPYVETKETRFIECLDN